MNELIALRQIKADGGSIGAVRKQSRPMHAVRAPLVGPGRGLVSMAPRAPRKKTRAPGAWAVLARAQACAVHRTTNRVRLKVSGHKHDEAFFAGLRHELLAQCGVVSVDVNTMTGSVVIVHDGTLDLRLEEKQSLRDGAHQVAAGQRSGDPWSRGGDLALLAIELVLAAITRELSSLIVELVVMA